MQVVQKLLIVNDLAIFALLILLIIGFLSYDYNVFGMSESILPIPEEFKVYFEFIPWLLFLLLSIDLFIKYLYVGRDLKYSLDYSYTSSVSFKIYQAICKDLQGNKICKIWL